VLSFHSTLKGARKKSVCEAVATGKDFRLKRRRGTRTNSSWSREKREKGGERGIFHKGREPANREEQDWREKTSLEGLNSKGAHPSKVSSRGRYEGATMRTVAKKVLVQENC